MRPNSNTFYPTYLHINFSVWVYLSSPEVIAPVSPGESMLDDQPSEEGCGWGPSVQDANFHLIPLVKLQTLPPILGSLWCPLHCKSFQINLPVFLLSLWVGGEYSWGADGFNQSPWFQLPVLPLVLLSPVLWSELALLCSTHILISKYLLNSLICHSFFYCLLDLVAFFLFKIYLQSFECVIGKKNSKHVVNFNWKSIHLDFTWCIRS